MSFLVSLVGYFVCAFLFFVLTTKQIIIWFTSTKGVVTLQVIVKNEDDLKKEDNLKKEDDLKKEDSLKNEDDLKNEDNLKNADDLK